MPVYVNPTGDVLGTAGDDTFEITLPPLAQSETWLRGLAGSDSLHFDVDYRAGLTFRAAFMTSDLTQFGGIIDSADYALSLSYYFFEALDFVGTDHDDRFELQITPAIGTETVAFDGGAGHDLLAFDFSALETGFSFVVAGDTITSTYGQFAGFERFEIRGTAANDVIRTGNGDDQVVSGAGHDRVATRGGDDTIVTRATGRFDGGAGYDGWEGDYGNAIADLTVAIGDGIAISNGTTVSNVEHVILATGSGDDTFEVTRVGPGMFDAGDGYDVLRVAAYAEQVDCTVAVGGGLSVGGAGPSFSNFEQVSLTGSAFDDAFRVAGLYQPAELTIDGGAGLDLLVVEFSLASRAIRFVAGAGGVVDSPYGAFTAFERFIVYGGARADVLVTGDADDFLGGLAGNDRLSAGAGSDTLWGGEGDDTLKGASGDDSLAGQAGNDLLDGGGGIDTASYEFSAAGVTVRLDRAGAQDTGGDGIDTLVAIENLTGSGQADTLIGGARANTLDGGEGNDLLNGLAGNDTLRGGWRDDTLRGGDGRDTLLGENGADLLDGGAGKDTLTGGAGRDVFQFRDGDFGATRPLADTITDFSRADGEKIQLNLVDANTAVDGNQAFAWIGAGAFTGVAGQLHYAQAAGNTYVEGDTNGDGSADFVIALTGTIGLAASDFVL